jgi:thymidylate synthase
MVTAWNVGELDSMVLPPCHYGFQVYTRELSDKERIEWMGGKIQEKYPALVEQQIKHCDEYNIPNRAISLMWNQRSVDTFLGLPFNIASYGLLLEIIAKAVNMVPDELIGNLGDTHLYLNHVEQAKEQIGRELSDEERYNIWFTNNYETGMERFFDSNNLPDFEDSYYEPTPKRTREPYPLPTLNINTEFWQYEGGECGIGPLDATGVIKAFSDDNFCRCLLEEDIQLGNYQSHPSIKAPLSN